MKTESAQLDGQTVHWNERLGALYDFPFSSFILYSQLNLGIVLHNRLHILYCVFMRSDPYALVPLSECVRYRYLLNPKVVCI